MYKYIQIPGPSKNGNNLFLRLTKVAESNFSFIINLSFFKILTFAFPDNEMDYELCKVYRN